jgi:hypothetical protein
VIKGLTYLARTFLFIATVFLTLTVLVGLLMKTGTVSQYVKHRLEQEFQQNFNGRLEIWKLNINFPIEVELLNSKVYIEDEYRPSATADSIAIKLSYFNYLEGGYSGVIIRNLLLSGLSFDVHESQSGELNFDRLLPEQKPAKSAPDSVSLFERLPNINCDNFEIRDLSVNWYRQDDSRQTTKRISDVLPTGLWKVKNGFHKTQVLELRDLGLKCNVKTAPKFISGVLNQFTYQLPQHNFQLNKTSAYFFFSDTQAEILALDAQTNRSNLTLSASIRDVDLFAKPGLKTLKDKPVFVQLNSNQLHRQDISLFTDQLPSTFETLALDVKIKGTFQKLGLEKCVAMVGKNQLRMRGQLNNVHDLNKLKGEFFLTDTRLNIDELSQLLNSEKLTSYKHINDVVLQGSLSGSKQKLSADLDLSSGSGKGRIRFRASDWLAKTPGFSGRIDAFNVDLSTLMNDKRYKSSLNSRIDFNGSGKTFNDLKTSVALKLDSTMIANRWISNGIINAKLQNQVIETDMALVSRKQRLSFKASADISTPTVKVKASGKARRLNLRTLLNNEDYPSNLNFVFNMNASGRKLGDLSAAADVRFDSSMLRGVEIEHETTASFRIEQDTDGSSIEVASDIIEFNAFGDFDLGRLKTIGEYETRAILKELSENNIFRKQFSISEKLGFSSADLNVAEDSVFKFPKLKMVFDAHLKNPKKVARIFEIGEFEAEGTFRGVIESSEDQFKFRSNANLESLRFKDQIAALALKYSINYTDSLIAEPSENRSRFLNIVEFDADKLRLGNSIFFGSNVLFDYKKRNLYLNIRTSDKSTDGLLDLETVIDFNDDLYDIDLKNFSFATTQVLWQLNPDARIRFSRKEIALENVILQNYDQLIRLEGVLTLAGYGEIDLKIKDLDLSELRYFIFDEKDKRFEGILNLNGQIVGTLEDPQLDMDLFIDNLAYMVIDVGHVELSSNYKQQLLSLDLDINRNKSRTDSLKLKPYKVNQLKLDGRLPIDLSFVTVEERFLNTSPIDVRLSSPNISPKVIEYFLPFFKNSNGPIPVKAFVGNYFRDPNIKIKSKLKNFITTVEPSGVTYKINGDLDITDSYIRPKNMVFQDYSGGSGVLTGEIIMDFFSVDRLNLKGTCSSLELLNKTDSGDQLFWGTVEGSSQNLSLSGTLDNPLFRGELFVDDANFSMLRSQAASSSQVAEASRFVKFVARPDPMKTDLDNFNSSLNKTLYLFEDNQTESENIFQTTFLDKLLIRDFILKNNRRLIFNMIFDRYSGEKLQTEINNLLMTVNKTGQEYTATGVVNMTSGKYNFATAAFDIQPEARVTWNNTDIREGKMENVFANRELRILDRQTNQIDDVTLSLYVGGTLDNPQVDMGYYFNQQAQPYSASESFGERTSTIDPNAQLNVMTLLFANQWYNKPGSSQSFESNTAISSVGLSTGAGLISAQLSRLASGISGLESVDLNITRDAEGAPVGVDLTVALTVPGTDGRLKLITSGTTSKTELDNQNAGYYSNAQRLEYQLTNNLVVEAYRTFGLNRNSVGYGFGDQVSEIWGLSVAYRENFRTWSELWNRIFKSGSDKQKTDMFKSDLKQTPFKPENVMLSN